MSWKSGTEPASPPRAAGRSIAVRLTMWYVLLCLGLLVAASSVLYWALASNLEREDDQRLFGKVAALRAAIVQRGSNLREIREEMERETATPGFYARLLDAHGRLIAESPHEDHMPDASLFDPALATSPTWQAQSRRGHDGRLYRIVAVVVDGPAASLYTILAAMDRSDDERLLHAYWQTVAYVLAVVLAIAVAVGYFIARRGLRPLARLSETVRRVHVDELHHRIGERRWPAELEQLAATFDQMLERLQESFERLSRFSADIAHELRTPLNVLRGEAEVALSKSRSVEEYRAALESSLEEYGRLTRLVDGLLFLARAENPETQIEKRPIELEREAESVCAFYEGLASEQGITLRHAGAARIAADAALVRRAVGNLVANAILHTPRGGGVTVDIVARDTRGADITVRDTGDGIAPQHLPRLFDRFYRAEDARPRDREGMGLGLAIVKSIMQLHGGNVSIQSELGRGTTVTLNFPTPPIHADSEPPHD